MRSNAAQVCFYCVRVFPYLVLYIASACGDLLSHCAMMYCGACKIANAEIMCSPSFRVRHNPAMCFVVTCGDVDDPKIDVCAVKADYISRLNLLA